MTEQARVTVDSEWIAVRCSQRLTHRSVDGARDLRVQIDAAVSAHGRACGRCDTTEARAWRPPQAGEGA